MALDPAYGVTSTGLVAKDLDTIKAELEAELRALFGESIDTSPQSNFGQFVGVMSEREADFWALLGAVWAAYSPDSATGVSLANVCGLTGTIQRAATNSSAVETLTGVPGTVIRAGALVNVITVGTPFATDMEATLVVLPSWVALTTYAVGDRRTNAGNAYICTGPGVSASSGGPATTAGAITDGTATWRFLGAGTGAADVGVQAQNTGPLAAVSGTLTVVGTPISGWTGALNISDAVLGSNVESDPSLRIRREQELRSAGKAAYDPIRENLQEVAGVTSVNLLQNRTDVVDGDGVDSHAVLAIVQGGLDADVAASLLANVAGGIGTSGATAVVMTDSSGGSHTIKFTRPAPVNTYVVIQVTYDVNLYPADGDAQIAAAVLAAGKAYPPGRDVRASALAATAFGAAGVLDCIALIGTAPAPGASTTIPISIFQVAIFDSARISVTSTPGTP